MPTPIFLPFPPLRVLECDGPISWERLEQEIGDGLDEGVSLCLVTEQGEPDRGGYFFHLQRNNDGLAFFIFKQQEGEDPKSVLTFETGEECATLMNHVSGRQYDGEMWSKCQEANIKDN